MSNHLITIHPQHSGRQELLDDAAVDFDMLQTGHESWSKAANHPLVVSAHYSKTPVMPTLVGESFYEGTQQTNWQDGAIRLLGLHDERRGWPYLRRWRHLADEYQGYPHGPSPFGVTYEILHGMKQ